MANDSYQSLPQRSSISSPPPQTFSVSGETVGLISRPSAGSRQMELRELFNRYNSGLEKMAQTEASIAVNQEELKALQPVLAQKVGCWNSYSECPISRRHPNLQL